jgi:tRNA (guanine-N7-)-methyltransferase
MNRPPSPSATPHDTRRILFGRRKGRPLRPARKRLVRDLLPQIAVPLDAGGGAPLLDPARFFDGPPAFAAGGEGGSRWREVGLEVGFGAGEHLAAQAEAHAEIAFIGCEPYLNGVAALLARVDARRLPNIRIYDDDARFLIERLAPGTLARVFALFPDPWPKARHARRRFIAADTLDDLARVMADGAELRFATDDPVYLRWALAALMAHEEFRWVAEKAADWRVRPADQLATRYEKKAHSKGVTPVFLVFERRPRSAPALRQKPQNT